MTDYKQIWEDVKANSALVSSCKKHKFEPVIQIGQKMQCLNCGGKINNVDLLYYIAGYEAAGGTADDIFPGWHTQKPKAQVSP